MSAPPNSRTVDALLPAALLAAAEHDVRSLLASIELGAATLEAHADDGELGQTGRIVGDASRQLSATLGELIETAGAIVADRTPVGPVDVAGLLGRVLSDCGVPSGALMVRQVSHVVTNEVLLRHLMWNLVADAVAAAGPDQVTVEVVPDSEAVTVVICNPADGRGSSPASDRVLHLDRGRGLRIVRILADAAGINYEHRVCDDVYTAQLRLPERVHHPSLLGEPTGIDGSATPTVVELGPRPD